MDQAINAGLALSCYARLALLGMAKRPVSPGTSLEIQRLLEHTVIDLSRGQYLDIHFQQRSPDFLPGLDEYLEMARLKTGVLLGTACEVGALVAGAQGKLETAGRFGEILGVTFQLRDDILGAWGDPVVMGKPASDVTSGKVTLPILLEAGVMLARPEAASETPKQESIERTAILLVQNHARSARTHLHQLALERNWEMLFEKLIDLVAERTL